MGSLIPKGDRGPSERRYSASSVIIEAEDQDTETPDSVRGLVIHPRANRNRGLELSGKSGLVINAMTQDRVPPNPF